MVPCLANICCCLCCGKDKNRNRFDSKPKFDEMADHYDEQKEQIDFLMSVKYKAQ